MSNVADTNHGSWAGRKAFTSASCWRPAPSWHQFPLPENQAKPSSFHEGSWQEQGQLQEFQERKQGEMTGCVGLTHSPYS